MNMSSFRINGLSYQKFCKIQCTDQWEKDIQDFLNEWFSADDFLITHTSGSTSAPKAIRLYKKDMIASAMMTNRFFKLPKQATFFLPLSAKYIAGKMMIIRALVCEGNLIVQSPSSCPQIPQNKPIDLAAMVPMQVASLIEKTPEQLSAIRTIIVGGAPIPNSLEEKLYCWKDKFYATYGMTETISHIAVRPITPNAPYQALGTVRFSCNENNCLHIEIPHLSIGKLQTNDVVQLVSPTSFFWLGRYDHVVNSGGIKLFPECIEQKIEAFLMNKRFYLLGESDAYLGEHLVLYIEDAVWSSADIEKLQEQLVRNISPYEIPKKIYFHSHFTETKSGKVKRIIL